MLVNLMQKKQLTKILPDVLVIVFCFISIGLSVIESRLNTDAHHWGLMYVNGADLNEGLIPYREIFIQYGYLTTLIQSLSLNIFGNTVVSVGIITGIFYAANIYLSYCLWQKVMNRWLSVLSAMLMFLVHGYIIYPWANYFSYTFLLISLLFLTSSPQKRNRYLLAGVFLGFSILARQSPLPLLASIYLYFLLLYFSSARELRKEYLKSILMFHVGMVSVIGVFLLYLVKESALEDWINQSFTIGIAYKSWVTPKRIYHEFIRGILFPRDKRLLLYSLVFFNALLLICKTVFPKGLGKLKKIQQQFSERDKLLFLFSSVTLFGYLQSLHIYELFRLQSSSSLGLGLLIFSLHNLSNRFKRWKKVVFTVPVICVFIYLSSTLIFKGHSSVYYPWNRELLLSHQLKEPENIEMLQGKLYNEETRIYFQTITKTINDYSCQLEYLVNFTTNSYVPLLSKSFKKVQKSPFYSATFSGIIFQDEQPKITQLLTQRKAIVIAAKIKEIPDNYQVVLKIKTPKNIRFVDRIIYVAVPKIVAAKSCPVTQVR
jgi:hypothetical protein